MHNSDESTDTSFWSLVEFDVALSESEILADLLWSLGVVAVEELIGNPERVILRTSLGEHPEHAIEIVRQHFAGVGIRVVSVSRAVADTWRDHAVPTWVNESVVLVPAWLAAPPGTDSIFIEPADTFGLGNHPTTVLALRLALAYSKTNDTVFDLGCGSGVLGIALSKLKNCDVDVFDIADGAQFVVEKNCAINKVTGVRWSHWPVLKTYDMVLANILAPVLISEAADLSTALTPGGRLVLSGMRHDQVSNVLAHFGSCSETASETQDGWTAVMLTKN